jgi:hypothetical protein
MITTWFRALDKTSKKKKNQTFKPAFQFHLPHLPEISNRGFNPKGRPRKHIIYQIHKVGNVLHCTKPSSDTLCRPGLLAGKADTELDLQTAESTVSL